MDSVTRTVTENGIRIVCETIPSVRSLAVGLWVKTGSRHEREEESGITHMIEHMLFKGTRKRTAYEIARSVEAAGGHINAFTANEYTCYYVRCLDSELDHAVDVLADMIIQPLFEASELKKEKKVIIEEMKMYRDTPDDFIMEEFTAALFKGHALGRPIIGTEETVNSFKAAGLRAYMADQYAPGNLILAVAGHCTAGQVAEVAQKALGRLSWKGPARQLGGAPAVNEPFSLRYARKIEQAHLVLGRQSISVNDPDRYVMLVLSTILSGGMSSRLHQNIREKYGYCYTIHAFNHSYMDSGYFGVYTGTDTAHLDEMKRLVFAEFDALCAAPVSEQELLECKAQLKGKVLLGQESMSNRMIRIGKNEIYYGRQVALDDMVAQVEQVSAAQLHAFCHRMLQQEAFSEAIIVPENE